MHPEPAQPDFIEPGEPLSQADLCGLCRLSIVEVDELVEFGVLTPLGETGDRRFSPDCVRPLREAIAMRARFDLDLFTVGLLFLQQQRIAELERRLRALEVRLPQAGSGVPAGAQR